MLNVFVFVMAMVVALVLSNLIVTAIMMKLFMNKKRIKAYTKLMVDVSNELAAEMLEEDGEL